MNEPLPPSRPPAAGEQASWPGVAAQSESAGSPPAADPLWTHPDIFHTVWEQAADAMVLSNAEGIVRAANPAYCRLYGYALDEVVGHSFAIIFPTELRAWAIEQYQQTFARSTPLPAYEATIRRRDGTERVVESRIDFLSTDGQRVAMLSTIRDVTERKRADDERAQLLAAEQQARMDAEAALQVRDQFLSIASYELRTPLTPLQGYAELLRTRIGAEQGSGAASARLAEAISRQAGRLNTLIGRLLDVSRLQQGRFVLERQPLDVTALVVRVVDEVRLGLPAQDGADPLAVTCPAEPLVVLGDRMRLEEVVLNVVSNAVKYSPAGVRVQVCVLRRGDAALVEVTDQGIGIPADAVPHLFEPFYRAGNVGTVISGFGIGLYIVAEIVQGHGGQISVSSTEGQGSTFRVTIPLFAADT